MGGVRGAQAGAGTSEAVAGVTKPLGTRDEHGWPVVEPHGEMDGHELEATLFAFAEFYGHPFKQMPLKYLAPALNVSVNTLRGWRRRGRVPPAHAKLLRTFKVYGRVF